LAGLVSPPAGGHSYVRPKTRGGATGGAHPQIQNGRFDYRTVSGTAILARPGSRFPQETRPFHDGPLIALPGVSVVAPLDPSSSEESAGSGTRLLRIPVNNDTSPMHPFSDYASFILDRMEPDRRYEPQDLRGFVPDISTEHLREIMHELWVNRQVERAGSSCSSSDFTRDSRRQIGRLIRSRRVRGFFQVDLSACEGLRQTEARATRTGAAHDSPRRCLQKYAKRMPNTERYLVHALRNTWLRAHIVKSSTHPRLSGCVQCSSRRSSKYVFSIS
jgi:hypothetical protein